LLRVYGIGEDGVTVFTRDGIECLQQQHLQPSTPSRLAINAADLPSRGGERVVECGGGRVITHPAPGFLIAIR